MAHKLDFKAQNQKNRLLKPAPDKYKLSDGRPNISMSTGEAPAFPLIPHKYLAACFQDINTQDWVVLPKGRLVSALVDGISDDVNTGQLGADGEPLMVENSKSYYGVSKNIKGLLVPANGGVTAVHKYQSESIGVVPKAGENPSGYAVEGDVLEIAANAPIGCVEHDVYQDIRGANLNYDMRNKNWGVLASQLIKIPSINLTQFQEFTEGIPFVLEKAGGTEVVVPNTFSFGAGSTSDQFYGVWSIAYEDEYTEAQPVWAADSDIAEQECVETQAPGSGDYGWNCDSQTGSCSGWDMGAQNTFTMFGASGGASGLAGNGCQGAGQFSSPQDVSLTYSDLDDGTDMPGGADTTGDGNFWSVDHWNGYHACSKKYSFFGYNGDSNNIFSGMLLKSDAMGNWMSQGDVNAVKTAQTAGRLLGVDSRFSKDMLDVVQGPYDQKVAGTQTLGVPDFLYDFAKTALSNAVYGQQGYTWPAGKDEAYAIKAAIDDGVFGYAWIQLGLDN
jgi:hypothetical protein